jgi:tRNA modification GTPase
MIFEHILGPGGMTQEGILVTNLRHCRNLEEAEQGLESAGSALQAGLSEEFALADLHRALGKLGEITGETGVDDILSGIFSQFCVGK